MKSFNLVNIAPSKIEDLSEVITHCEFHPIDSHKFLYSSSKGYFMVGDLRLNTKEEGFGVKVNTVDEEAKKN